MFLVFKIQPKSQRGRRKKANVYQRRISEANTERLFENRQQPPTHERWRGKIEIESKLKIKQTLNRGRICILFDQILI